LTRSSIREFSGLGEAARIQGRRALDAFAAMLNHMVDRRLPAGDDAGSRRSAGAAGVQQCCDAR
jgi:hypothetical protein